VELARVLALASLVACSGNKARPGDDALHAPRGDAPSSDAAPTPSSTTGDAQVHVEWKAVTAAARSSPGRTPCNTPRAASVAPTTVWGIPDALVLVDGAPPITGDARVVLADCALRPRVAAGTTLVIESAVDRPARVTLVKQGTVADNGAFRPGPPRVIQLPIAGHAVSVALDPGGVYLLATDGADPETAWIVAVPAAITDASGQATVKGLSAGRHAVTAWLPARGNQLQHRAGTSVDVPANDLAEITLDLAPPP